MSTDIEHEPWRSSEYGNLELVRAVQKRPCLYNNTLPEYSRKDITGAAWQEIADEFGSTVAECKRKWKNLRAVYAREISMRRKKKRPYYLVDHMNFLLPFVQSHPNDKYRTLISALCERKCDHPADIPQPNVDEDNNDVSSSGDDVKAELANAIAEFHNSDVNMTADDSVSTRTVQPIIMKCVKAVDRTIPSGFQTSSEDHRRQFIMSMLPEIEEMTEKQFRHFKRKIFEMIDDIVCEHE